MVPVLSLVQLSTHLVPPSDDPVLLLLLLLLLVLQYTLFVLSLSLSLYIYIYMYKTTVSSVHSGRLVLAVAAITTTTTINKMRKHVLMITKDLSLMKQGK